MDSRVYEFKSPGRLYVYSGGNDDPWWWFTSARSRVAGNWYRESCARAGIGGESFIFGQARLLMPPMTRGESYFFFRVLWLLESVV